MAHKIVEGPFPAFGVVDGGHFFTVGPGGFPEAERIGEAIVRFFNASGAGGFRFSPGIETGEPFKEQLIEEAAAHVAGGVVGVEGGGSSFLKGEAQCFFFCSRVV